MRGAPGALYVTCSALRGPLGPYTHMGLHDVRFFLCPGVFCLCRTQRSIINLTVFLGGHLFTLLRREYVDRTVLGLGFPGSWSCTLWIV